MTQNRQARLQFINKNLEWGDNKVIADRVNKLNGAKPCKCKEPKKCDCKNKPITSDIVSKVRSGRRYSKRIFDACEAMAMENKKKTLAIADYMNKSVSI